MLSCDAAPNGSVAAWSLTRTDSNIAAPATCPSGHAQDSGLSVYNVADNNLLSTQGQYGTWGFDAPSGTTIDGVAADYEIVRRDQQVWWGGWGIGSTVIRGCYFNTAPQDCTLGTTPGAAAWINTAGATNVNFIIGCSQLGDPWGCTHGWAHGPFGSQMAVIVRSAAVRVNDSSAPSVAIVGGGLTGADGTVRGTQTVSYNASDNVGIKGVSFAIDGVQRDSALSNCDFTRRVPCPNLSGASQSFDTSRLDDGPHTLTVTATDSAGNSRTTGSSSFVIDNGAPAAPSDVVVDQGEAWRSQPTYSVRWTNPSGQVSPIARAHYLLCDAVWTSNCEAVQSRSGAGISSVSDVRAPAAGDWLLSVYLEDQLGNVRASNASTPVHLRFDDSDPGLAAPATPARWLAATEYDAALRVDTPSPPSGIAGYSVTTDGTDPDTTVDVGAEGIAHLANLPEGRVTVKARAVSNSGVASGQVGSGLLLIDRSVPYVGASGAPDPSVWQASAVTVSLAAGDQIGLSGVEDGSITYAVDGGASQVVHGSSASISASSDGPHTVAYKATDAAGNESAESTVSFKIDATPPIRPELSDPGRWLNADDASGYVEHLSVPVTPRSGLQGYSVSTDGSDPDSTVDAGSDMPLPDLPDGATTVRARAVSGSALASDSAGVVELQVDKRPPTVGASGVPGAGTWTAGDVDLDIQALDQPGLSGMDRGRIVYSVDDGDCAEASGNHARITVSGDGEHSVRYWAEDAAGNRSATEVARFVLDAAMPGRARPEGTDGWISPAAGRYLERIRLDDGAAPPSGIAGYSVTIDGSDPDGSLDTGPDGNFEISELADGITIVKARAISGAGVGSSEVGSAELRIDRSAPEVLGIGTESTSEIAVRVADSTSGVVAGTVELRGQDGWRELVTRTVDGRLVARLDTNALPRALYEFRATVTDAAGNRRTTDSLVDGSKLALLLGTDPPPTAPSAPVASQPTPAPIAAAVPAPAAPRACKGKSRSRRPHKCTTKRHHKHAKHKGGEKHRHRHLGPKTHKRARRHAG